MEVSFDEKKIDSILARFNQCHLPGVAAGIAINRRPVYRKGFGVANMEVPVLLSPATRMRIGSISKHFTSLLYLLLCEGGVVTLGDPVRKYLPELNAVTHNITMRQLMSHMSGLRDVFDISWQFSGIDRFVTSENLLGLYRDIDDVNAAPGVTWSYNNGGYLILTAVIERIADKSLEDLLRERIFDPIGMFDTLLRRSEAKFVPNSATPHMTCGDGGYEKSVFFGTEFAGEGGIVSTVDDMLRWLSHMEAPHIGAVSSWNAMKAPQTLLNGISVGYGLGLMLGQFAGAPTIYHSGGGMGANAQMLKVPSLSLDLIVMSNREDAWAVLLVDEILRSCIGGLKAKEDAINEPRLFGTYLSGTTNRVIQLCVNGQQQIASIDGMDIPMEPDESGSLRPGGVFAHLNLLIESGGNSDTPGSIRYTEYGAADTLRRQDPTGGSDEAEIEGGYQSNTTGTKVLISAGSDGHQFVATGIFGSVVLQLEFIADRVWRARSRNNWYFGGVLVFSAGRESFEFSSHRTRSLKFHRY